MMRRDGPAMVPPLMAGFVLATAEILFVGTAARETFRNLGELGCFAVASLTSAAAVCIVAWALASAMVRVLGADGIEPDPRRRGRVARRVQAVVVALALPVAAAVLWLLTSGRRLRDAPGRLPLVAVAAVALALLAGGIGRRVADRARRADSMGWGASISWAALGLVALVADGTVLPRLYPTFHLALAAGAVGAMLLAAVVLPVRFGARLRAWPVVIGLLAVAAAPFTLRAVLARSNAAFVTERWAPITGKLVAAMRRSRAQPPSLAVKPVVAPAPAPVDRGPGIDLAHRSVLFITVDALRADRLDAYGGHALTPHMNALARSGAVFAHAYTSTPHTSYALGSLWTGRDLRSAGALAGRGGSSVTVADRLRRYGYQTAAFYPPAVFFVDTDRFVSLKDRGFGFEHRKVDGSSADQRAAEVAKYVASTDLHAPLFIWVHLFEPHEPYDPPPAFARGDSDIERYNGEVAAADAAVGRLVASFRRYRPDGTVILTADHGEEFEDHGGHYHGTTLYDEQVHIPLLWSSPGRVPPHRIDGPVCLTDLAVTLLLALGVPPARLMRGRDLGPALEGNSSGPRYAFASVGEMRMAMDGRYKAICTLGQPICRLYDLQSDPKERTNIAEDDPSIVQRLTAAIGRHLSAIAEQAGAVDARALLDRARLGDPTVAPRLEPLLGDDDVAVRAEAARGLGRLGQASALPMLRRLATDDPAPGVRIEAAVAVLRLGDASMAPAVRRWLVAHRKPHPTGADVSDLQRRAALALAAVRDATGAPELTAVAVDPAREAEQRRGAVLALGIMHARRAVPELIPLLADIRLRIDVARTLGRIGDRRAVGPLKRQLRQETYPGARKAEEEALTFLRGR